MIFLLKEIPNCLVNPDPKTLFRNLMFFSGISSSFKILGVVDEVPVEYTFPLYSPLVSKIRLVKKRFIKKEGKSVRRGKVYYIRDLPTSVYTVTRAHMQEADAQDKRNSIAAKKAAKRKAKDEAKAASELSEDDAGEG